MSNIYIDPFDYFSRRRDKNLEGRIVYTRRRIEDREEVLADPFLIIAKIEGKIYAVRLRDEDKNKKIQWNSEQTWTISANYLVEAKEKENLFYDKLPSSEFKISVETVGDNRKFNIDLNKIYLLKHLKEHDAHGDAPIFIEHRIFNDIVGLYSSYSPNSFIAEYYNFTNWEEGN